MGPRWAQDGAKMPQDGPKMPQDCFSKPEDCSKMAPRAQDEDKMPQIFLKKALTRLLGTLKIVLSPRRRAIFAEIVRCCPFLVFPRLLCPFEAKIDFKMALGWPEAAP